MFFWILRMKAHDSRALVTGVELVSLAWPAFWVVCHVSIKFITKMRRQDLLAQRKGEKVGPGLHAAGSARVVGIGTAGSYKPRCQTVDPSHRAE